MSNHRSNDTLDNLPTGDEAQACHNNDMNNENESSVSNSNEHAVSDSSVNNSDPDGTSDSDNNSSDDSSAVVEEATDRNSGDDIASMMGDIIEEMANNNGGDNNNDMNRPYAASSSDDDDSSVRRLLLLADNDDASDDDNSSADESSVDSNDSMRRRNPEMFMAAMIGRMTEISRRLRNLEEDNEAEEEEMERLLLNSQPKEKTLSNRTSTDDDDTSPVVVPPSAEACAASYQFLQHMLEEEEPGLYLNLPLELQSDPKLAQAALRGTTNLLLPNGRNDQDGGNAHTTSNYMHTEILNEICQNRPEILCDENCKTLFLVALERVDNISFYAECILDLNSRGIVDDVYQELCRFFLLDNTSATNNIHIEQLLWEECYTGLLDVSLQCHTLVIRQFLESIPSKEMLQAIPAEAQLSEEHFIRAIMSLYRNDYQLDEGEGTAFELDDIPEQYPKSRQLYAHLENLVRGDDDEDDADLGDNENRFRRFQFSFPPELCTDRSVCLACLPGSSKSEFPKVWRSIDQSLRKENSFVLEAIALNLELYNGLRKKQREFDVWLAATAAHGYHNVLLTLKRQPIESISELEDELEEKLGRFDPFWTFLQGISSASSSSCFLNLLRLDPETSTRLKQEISQYADVPTGSYLTTLRRADGMRQSFYSDFQQTYRRRRNYSRLYRSQSHEDPFLRKIYRLRRR